MQKIEIRGIKDPYQENPHWQVADARDWQQETKLAADVVIIGSGAGGGICAQILSEAGFKVIILEEGPLKTNRDFKMLEQPAYQDLYQEAAGRMTKDQSISILQGRCVGGTTVINWTSAFRTPEQTLKFWTEAYDVKGVLPEDLAPWFEKIEKELNIHTWPIANENNQKLNDGCEKLGFEVSPIPRNVKACWNLGYCGLGCPTNAKQSMLTTAIPNALENGATLIHNAKAEKLLQKGKTVTGVECALPAAPTQKLTITAKHTIIAAGAINGPGLLLRSDVPDPYERLGRRTFVHPTPFTFAQFDDTIDPYWGAPQSRYSDHFIWKDGVEGPMGYKLEVPPLQPGLTSALLCSQGQANFEDMSTLPNMQSVLALLRDGFHPASEGGTVSITDDGTPVLDYPITDYVWDGVRRAHRTMAEVQFAAGAKRVKLAHVHSDWYDSFEALKKAQDNLVYQKYDVMIGSAHVMGGCGMGDNPEVSVVDSQCRFHQLDALSVIDGSVFPTSIGTNPQLTIYALAAKQATQLASDLKSAKT